MLAIFKTASDKFTNHLKTLSVITRLVRLNLEKGGFAPARETVIESSLTPHQNAVDAREAFELEINKKQPRITDYTLIASDAFHPPYYALAPHINHDLDRLTRAKIQEFSKASLEKLSAGKKPIHEPMTHKYEVGNFYFPMQSAEGKNTVIAATEQQIAEAHCILGMPLYARTDADITWVVDKMCQVLGFESFAALQKAIPKGVVIYVGDMNHHREIAELRTLRYLEKSNYETLSPWDYGNPDVYEKFVKPKLFTADNKLVAPELFYIRALTASYSNRMFDQLMGMIYDEVKKHGGDPKRYLAQCYGFHLIANPYNFNSQWCTAADWRTQVILNVPSDTIWSYMDLATRVMPTLELLLVRFRQHRNNTVRLAGTKRNAIIISADIPNNFSGMSLPVVAAAVLGHDLEMAVKAVMEQENQLISALRKYFTGEISTEMFNAIRLKKDGYQYNPVKGIALKEVLYMHPSSPTLMTLLLVPQFWYVLYLVLNQVDVLSHPRFITHLTLALTKYKKQMNFIRQNSQATDLINYLSDSTLGSKVIKHLSLDKLASNIIRFSHSFYYTLDEVGYSLTPIDFSHLEENGSLQQALTMRYVGQYIKQWIDTDLVIRKILIDFFNDIIKSSQSSSNTPPFIYDMRSTLTQIVKLAAQKIKLTPEDLKNFKKLDKAPSLIYDKFVIASIMKDKRVYTEAARNLIGDLTMLEERIKYHLEFEPYFFNISHVPTPESKVYQVGKKILLRFLTIATTELVDRTEKDDLYCAITYKEFSYLMALKTRAAQQAYYNYLKSIAHNNPAVAKFIALSQEINLYVSLLNIAPFGKEYIKIRILALLQQANEAMQQAMKIKEARPLTLSNILNEKPTVTEAESTFRIRKYHAEIVPALSIFEHIRAQFISSASYEAKYTRSPFDGEKELREKERSDVEKDPKKNIESNARVMNIIKDALDMESGIRPPDYPSVTNVKDAEIKNMLDPKKSDAIFII